MEAAIEQCHHIQTFLDTQVEAYLDGLGFGIGMGMPELYHRKTYAYFRVSPLMAGFFGLTFVFAYTKTMMSLKRYSPMIIDGRKTIFFGFYICIFCPTLK